MNTAIEQMLKNYQIENIYDQKNVMKEIMQEIVLCGLSRAFFFRKQPFMGERHSEFFMGCTIPESRGSSAYFGIYLLGRYMSFASNNCRLHRPYIVRFIIFNLLFVPSTNPLDKGLTTEFSTASISFSSPTAKRDNSGISDSLYFSMNK